MGDVRIVYKLMPENPKADLDEIKEEVKKIAEEYGEYKGSNEEKVAFGLMAVISTIEIPDEGGIVDVMEEKLRSIPGIQSAEAADMTLI
ncbi:MAG: elongation factor 1-beta [Candidatus Saliniplasma sp.]